MIVVDLSRASLMVLRLCKHVVVEVVFINKKQVVIDVSRKTRVDPPYLGIYFDCFLMYENDFVSILTLF